MALDDALEAFALRLADHVDRVARLEDVDLHFVADIRVAVVRQLDERPHRRDSRLLEVAALRAGHPPVGDLLHQSDLDGIVAILLGSLLLHDEARSGLNHGHGDEYTVLLEDLSHSDLLTDDSFDCHSVHLVLSS